MEIKPNNNTISIKRLIPQILIKDFLHKAKTFFNKSFKYINSVLFQGREKPPEATKRPIFTSPKKFGSKPNKTYSNIPERSVLKGLQKKQEIPKERSNKRGEQQRINAASVSFSNCRGSRLKEDSRSNASKRKQQQEEEEDLSSLAFEALAHKTRELEMMDLNDVNHMLDVEEVLHYYSRLKCPAYLEIIEKFFMDMYLEYRLPQTSSRSGSMRRAGSIGRDRGSTREVPSNSVHGSMRSLAPLKL